MKRQRVTLADVARHLNISRATVSNALNGNRYVSPRTKERVQEACKQLGYRVNALAQGLRTNKTRIIGVTVPDIQEPFLGSLVRNVEIELKEYGYEMLLGSYFFDTKEEERILRTFEALRLDGIVAISGLDNTLSAYTSIAAEIPVVFLERNALGARISSVLLDSFQFGVDAVSYLYGHGHRRIAYLTIEYDNFRILKDRYLGYVEGLKRHSLPYSDDLVIKRSNLLLHEIEYTLSDIRELYEHLVANGVTAVLVVSDYVAVALIKGLTSIGVRVPQDVSILSVTNISYGTVTTPTLSTYDIAPQNGAHEAVGLLMKMQTLQRRRVQKIYLPHTLVERESVLDLRTAGTRSVGERRPSSQGVAS